MISDAIVYPFRGAGKLRHLFGGLAILFSVLVLPLIPLVGYVIHVLTFVSIGNDTPPSVSEYTTLLKNGVIGTAIIFSYTGIFIALPLLIISYTASVIYDPTTVAEFITVLDWMFYLLVGFGIMMMSLLPLILCQYGRRGTYTAAYDVQGLIELLRTRPVQKAVISTIGIGLLTAILFTGVSIVTLGFGVIFAPVVAFWFSLVTAYLYGRGVGVATGTISPVNFSDVVTEVSKQDSHGDNQTRPEK